MIRMQYIGKNKLTIKHGAIGTVVSINRVKPDSRVIDHYPSRICLWMKLDNGHTFGGTDRNDWKRI